MKLNGMHYHIFEHVQFVKFSLFRLHEMVLCHNKLEISVRVWVVDTSC
jgi:hypothetical protein